MVSIPKFHYKNNTESQVAICVPVRDLVTAAFTYSLSMLTKKCGEAGVKVSLHMVMGSEIAMQRQQLVDEALQTDCTHILWLDSDMKFPTNVLEALLSYDKDIIACNYSTRVPPHRPVAFKMEGNLDSRVFNTTGVEEIFAVGMGCMLVKREVYERIERPHFSVAWNDDFTNLVGEDVFFCKKAKENGYTVWLENELSQKLAHVGTRPFTLKGDCND